MNKVKIAFIGCKSNENFSIPQISVTRICLCEKFQKKVLVLVSASGRFQTGNFLKVKMIIKVIKENKLLAIK